MSRTYNFLGGQNAPYSSLMYIDGSGNIGVGTTTPQGKLDIKGDIKSTGALIVNGLEVISSSGIIATSAMPATMNTQSMSVGVIGAADISCSNMTIAGDLVVLGSNVNLDVQTVLIEDNILLVNKNQTGVPSALLKSGIEVERGDYPNYQFVFEEQSQLFKVGTSGSGSNNLQAVATRPDVVTDGALGYWNASNTQFSFNSNIRIDASGLAASTVNAQKVNVTGDIYFTGSLYQNGSLFTSGGGGALSVDDSDVLTLSTTSNVSILKGTNVIYNEVANSVIGMYVDNASSEEQSYGTVTDSSFNIYMIGYYSANVTPTVYNLNNSVSSITLRTNTKTTAFIVKYNPSGVAQWAACMDPDPDFTSLGAQVKCDASNNVYMSVKTSNNTGGTIYDASGTGQAISPVQLIGIASQATYFIKISPTGVAQWATAVYGNSGYPATFAIDPISRAMYVTCKMQNIYQWNGTGQAADGPSLGSTTNTNGIVKYDLSGRAVWAARITSTGGSIFGGYIDADSSGNVLCTGIFTSSGATATIYDANGLGQVASACTLKARSANNIMASYLAKFSSAGVCQWSVVCENIGTWAYGGTLASDLQNNVYWGFYDTPAFGSAGQYTMFQASGTGQVATTFSSSGARANVWKVSTSGQIQLTFGVVGSGAGGAYEPRLSVDTSCNVNMGGTTSSSRFVMDYNGASGWATSSQQLIVDSSYNGSIGYALRFNISGVCTNATCFPASTVNIHGCHTDSLGRIYVSGGFGNMSGSPANVWTSSGTGFYKAFTFPGNTSYYAWCTRVTYQPPAIASPYILQAYGLANGFQKIVINTHTTTQQVHLVNSSGNTLLTAVIPINTAKKYIWYGTTWYDL